MLLCGCYAALLLLLVFDCVLVLHHFSHDDEKRVRKQNFLILTYVCVPLFMYFPRIHPHPHPHLTLTLTFNVGLSDVARVFVPAREVSFV